MICMIIYKKVCSEIRKQHIFCYESSTYIWFIAIQTFSIREEIQWTWWHPIRFLGQDLTVLQHEDRLICIFLRNIWRERKKSAFGKLFSSQNTEAEQTFQPSLAGHHSHPMYLFFSSDKRATFGIAQAAELIIATPWGCFKLWAYPPLMSWNPHNHQAESGKPCSLSDVG